jgi:hypothetical protein
MVPWPTKFAAWAQARHAHTCPTRAAAYLDLVWGMDAIDMGSYEDKASAPRATLSTESHEGLSSISMMPRAIRTLPEAEVIARWADLYVAGKHKGYAPPLIDQHLGRDATWVEVEVPHDLYDADWNTEGADLSAARLRRAEEYAHREGPLPPGMASFNERRARRGTKTLFVSDGNHRAYAAFLRGSPTARFFIPRNEWERFQQAIG